MTLRPPMLLVFMLSLLVVGPAGSAFAAPPAKASPAKASPTKATATDDWPDTSLFHLESSWVDQDGKPTDLADFSGKHIVVALIFTHCKFSCPVTVAHLKALQTKLTPQERGATQFVLVTLDPTRDTPAVLKAFAKKRALEAPRWTLMRGEADVVRDLSVALQMRFKETGKGEFSHGRAITILGPTGTIVYQGQDTTEELDVLRGTPGR